MFGTGILSLATLFCYGSFPSADSLHRLCYSRIGELRKALVPFATQDQILFSTYILAVLLPLIWCASGHPGTALYGPIGAGWTTFAWAAKAFGGRSFHQRIARFSFVALCHLIWKERNDILFRDRPLLMMSMKKQLLKVVKDKAISIKPIDDTPRNRRVQRSWELPPSIFE